MDKTFVYNLLSTLEKQPDDTILDHFSLSNDECEFETINISHQVVTVRGLSKKLKTQLNATVNTKTSEVTHYGFTHYEPPK